MSKRMRRIWTALLALAMILSAGSIRGQAVLQGVYFTAANEQIMDLTAGTMPFWSGDTLYVSSEVFEGRELGITYVKNASAGTAVLYTTRTDLRFDLAERTVHDKTGKYYNGYAIERGGEIFFPLQLVCQHFGLTWSYNETKTVPLIRVKSDSAILEDRDFLDAAANLLERNYEAYEKLVAQQGGQDGDAPPVQAADGQMVHLVIESLSVEDTLAAVQLLEDAQATFLLSAEQMEQGDLIRALVARGHGVALLVRGASEAEIAAEVERARELVWQSSVSWLHLVWYEAETDVTELLSEMGCSLVTADLDWRSRGLGSTSQARTLLTQIGRYRENVTVCLGSDSDCLGGIAYLAEYLQTNQYRVCPWRASAGAE